MRVTELAGWLRALLLRKPTTPVHVISGMLVAFLLCSERWLLGLVLFAGFALFEWWESRVIGDDGHKDYWEFLAGMFLAGAALLLI